jgi:hypothetical protein
MSTLRLQCSWKMDSAFPRDAMQINPVFDVGFDLQDPTAEADAEQLCIDLADGISAWDGSAAEVTVKAYDVQGTQPVYAAGQAVRNVGGIGSSGCPRELALCLSFYSAHNAPRLRGRVYIPAVFLTSAPGQRPTTAQMNNVGSLALLFQALGGANVDWSIWSPTTSERHAVTHWWVDDEWDVQRSRGLRATTRVSGTTDES